MHLRTTLVAAAATVLGTLGLVIVTPSAALAGPLVTCGSGAYNASTHTYTFLCDLVNVTASGELWTGIQVTAASQGTAHATGQCVMVPATRPYRPSVTYVNTATGQTVTTTSVPFLCNGMTGF